jgi:hypothetical protein
MMGAPHTRRRGVKAMRKEEYPMDARRKEEEKKKRRDEETKRTSEYWSSFCYTNTRNYANAA